jgi:hypothetical protein
MKFIAMVLSFVLFTAVYWIPIATGVVALLDGHVAGILLIVFGLWLAFRA